jgi:hypothetical protein
MSHLFRSVYSLGSEGVFAFDILAMPNQSEGGNKATKAPAPTDADPCKANNTSAEGGKLETTTKMKKTVMQQLSRRRSNRPVHGL